MTTAVQHLIDSFDALPEADKHKAVVEILRRATPAEESSLDDMLAAAADELFVALDAEEASHAQS